MDLELNRVDYCFVGTTLRNSMKLLPGIAYKQQQQVKDYFAYKYYLIHIYHLICSSF